MTGIKDPCQVERHNVGCYVRLLPYPFPPVFTLIYLLIFAVSSIQNFLQLFQISMGECYLHEIYVVGWRNRVYSFSIIQANNLFISLFKWSFWGCCSPAPSHKLHILAHRKSCVQPFIH